jgi:hypothetical protein
MDSSYGLAEKRSVFCAHPCLYIRCNEPVRELVSARKRDRTDNTATDTYALKTTLVNPPIHVVCELVASCVGIIKNVAFAHIWVAPSALIIIWGIRRNSPEHDDSILRTLVMPVAVVSALVQGHIILISRLVMQITVCEGIIMVPAPLLIMQESVLPFSRSIQGYSGDICEVNASVWHAPRKTWIEDGGNADSSE